MLQVFATYSTHGGRAVAGRTTASFHLGSSSARCRQTALVLIVGLTVAACAGQRPDPRSWTDLLPPQAATLSELGLRPADVYGVRPASRHGVGYTKVRALDSAGAWVDLLLDNDTGEALSDEDLNARLEARAERFRLEHGRIDRVSRHLLDTRYKDRAEITYRVMPRFELPEEPPPGPIDGSLSRQTSTLWEAHYRTLQERQDAAVLRLAKSLPSEARILSMRGSALLVASDRQTLETVIRREDVLSSQLTPDLLPPARLADDSDEEIGVRMSFLQGAPFNADGRLQEERIGVGIRDSGLSTLGRSAGNTLVRTYHGIDACLGDGDCSEGELRDDRCVNGTCFSRHGTGVLNVLAGVDNQAPPALPNVGAPGIQAFYQSLENHSLWDAIEWWRKNGVHLANQSGWGRDASYHFDWGTYANNIAILQATGNDGPEGSSHCGESPSHICVGGSRIRDGQLSGMYNRSGSQDWPNLDRDFPDLVAPAQGTRCFQPGAGAFNWGPCTGTSFAAPMATAVAALLHDISRADGAGRHYPELKHHPELTKAILMAGATHNIEGEKVSMAGDGVDERDGAGNIRADQVIKIFNRGWFAIEDRVWPLIDGRHFPELASVDVRRVRLEQDEKLRAFIAWTRCPSSLNTDVTEDFDLRVVGPDGGIVESLSFHQAHEGVYHGAFDGAGEYAIQVKTNFVLGQHPVCGNQRRRKVALAYHVWTPPPIAPPRVCGDGLVHPGEVCDGDSDGAGNPCNSWCSGYCGDGALDRRENCDPGANPNCHPDCASSCGDGVTQAQWEVCDGGVDGSGNPCNSWCSGYCGNGVLDSGEKCERPDPSCHPDCASSCGDGVLQARFGETCDDGANNNSAGGCHPGCQSSCGDSVRNAQWEKCDDGADIGRIGFPCNAWCTGKCGDGVTDRGLGGEFGGEQCDLGEENGVEGGGPPECDLNCLYGVEPEDTCEFGGPGGSSNCGNFGNPDGETGCNCDPGCAYRRDCCGDYIGFCGGQQQ